MSIASTTTSVSAGHTPFPGQRLHGARAPMWIGVTVLGWHTAVAAWVGARAWDDGAITVAFARTFATSGRIALTPGSPQVEGFSSPAWFLLNAAGAAGAGDRFGPLLLVSQLLSAIAAASAAVLLFLLLRPRVPTVGAVVLAVAPFVLAPAVNETANGMEMTALCAVALGAALALDRGAPWWTLAGLAALVPAVRVEAVGYLAVAAVGLLLLPRFRARGAALLVGATGCVVALTLVRLAVFGLPVPNTVLAKQHAPYTLPGFHGRLVSLKVVSKELALVLLPALAVAVGALLATGRRSIGREARVSVRQLAGSPVLLFAAGWVAGVVAVNLVLGSNWGYLGRMEFSALPLAIVLVAGTVPTGWLRRALPPTAVAAVILAVGVVGVRIEGVGGTSSGAANAVPVTAGAYQASGQVFDRVRVLLGAPELTVAVPDVGGAALCCPNLRVVDLGLLTSPELASGGPGRLREVLDRYRPEVVEVHERWAQALGIYEEPAFRDGYIPVTAGGMWFYLRRDIAERLRPMCTPTPLEQTSGLRYRGVASDEQYVTATAPRMVCGL